MNISKFNPKELINNQLITKSKVEEAKRLADELRSKPATIIKADNFHHFEDIIKPAVKGFDVETCSLLDITKYIKTHPKISQSLLMFLYRIMAVRFSTDFKIMKKTSPHKLEIELIESQAKNDIAWLGEVGFQNSVRLDQSLSLKSVNVIKAKNDQLRFSVK